ncbi:MAG: type II secretion system F family protein [Gammaproteobacteria bacterium]|nr:type II secretion system F family protein [Gammaproteobacteria bacterium]
MAQFAYTGRNVDGQPVSGQTESTSASILARQLMSQGITPVRIREAGMHMDVSSEALQRMLRPRVQISDLIFFSRQMYTLQRSGVPILHALAGLRDSTRNERLSEIIGKICESLDSGMELSAAMRQHKEVFSPLYINLIQVGETTGSLDTVFQQLARYLEKEKETRQRIKSAMRYPVFVIATITVAIAIINLFVIPAFAKVYSGFNAELPMPTRIIIATSNFTVTYWPVVLLVIGGLVTAWLWFIRQDYGRMWWDERKLHIPVTGLILYGAALSRFATSMSMIMRAGVPVVQGMAVVAQALGNKFMESKVTSMRAGLERGESITHTAKQSEVFSPVSLQMLQVGEDTGSLDELMSDVAQYYDDEVDYALKNLSTAIEPILLFAVGGLVLMLALGVFMPMWNLSKVMGVG